MANFPIGLPELAAAAYIALMGLIWECKKRWDEGRDAPRFIPHRGWFSRKWWRGEE